MGFCMNLDDVVTGIGMCFPIYVAVSVSLKNSSSTEIDSKSEMAMLVGCFFVCLINESRETKRVKFVEQCFMELINLLRVHMFISFNARG